MSPGSRSGPSKEKAQPGACWAASSSLPSPRGVPAARGCCTLPGSCRRSCSLGQLRAEQDRDPSNVSCPPPPEAVTAPWELGWALCRGRRLAGAAVASGGWQCPTFIPVCCSEARAPSGEGLSATSQPWSSCHRSQDEDSAPHSLNAGPRAVSADCGTPQLCLHPPPQSPGCRER